jgi:hypothetical protein
MGNMGVYSRMKIQPHPVKVEAVVSFNNVNLISLMKLAYFFSIYFIVKFENDSENEN